jgi:hypothetical protein
MSLYTDWLVRLSRSVTARHHTDKLKEWRIRRHPPHYFFPEWPCGGKPGRETLEAGVVPHQVAWRCVALRGMVLRGMALRRVAVCVVCAGPGGRNPPITILRGLASADRGGRKLACNALAQEEVNMIERAH